MSQDTRVYQQNQNTVNNLTIKLVLTAMYAAVGVYLSYLNPFAYISIMGVKPNPFAHLINAIAGVTLGPIYAVLTATLIAFIRYYAGIGSILAFPGGIPGALIVGLASYFVRKRLKTENESGLNPKYLKYTALTEPLGTVFIGGTISNFIIPLGLYYMWFIFAISCILGSILGFLTIVLLEQSHQFRSWFGMN